MTEPEELETPEVSSDDEVSTNVETPETIETPEEPVHYDHSDLVYSALADKPDEFKAALDDVLKHHYLTPRIQAAKVALQNSFLGIDAEEPTEDETQDETDAEVTTSDNEEHPKEDDEVS